MYLATALLLGSGAIGFKLPGWIAAAERSERGTGLFEKGTRLLEEDPAQAAVYFSAAADLTGSATQRLWHAIAVEGQGLFDEAADLYMTSWLVTGMGQSTLRGTIASCLAHVSIRRGEFVDAEEWASKSIEKLPDSDYGALSYAYLDRGVAKWSAGREAEAKRDFEWVLAHPAPLDNQRLARSLMAAASLTEAAGRGLEGFLEQASVFRLDNSN